MMHHIQIIIQQMKQHLKELPFQDIYQVHHSIISIFFINKNKNNTKSK
jgi:hypothetical protein